MKAGELVEWRWAEGGVEGNYSQHFPPLALLQTAAAQHQAQNLDFWVLLPSWVVLPSPCAPISSSVKLDSSTHLTELSKACGKCVVSVVLNPGSNPLGSLHLGFPYKQLSLDLLGYGLGLSILIVQ